MGSARLESLQSNDKARSQDLDDGLANELRVSVVGSTGGLANEGS
jgi:hypothetical protein